MTGSVVNQIRKNINRCMIKDRYPLKRRLRRLRPDDSAALEKLQKSLVNSQELVRQRTQTLPVITYNPDLPVVDCKDEIAAAICHSQVIVIAGETGSGKTTQLPKICLEAGRGIYGQIGHTQPRRLAARSVAARIAEELKVPMGKQVGYQVRFSDHSDDNTLIKLMTDGILLAEIQHDPFLSRYDTLIIDEAHERSLNIDFLLGYIKLIMPKRSDLKLIITSATIDVDRFSKHFDNAPIIEVSGRTYPVELVYRPMEALVLQGRDADQRLQQSIYAALIDIIALEAKGQGSQLGDVLVFLSSEREIRETAQFLRDIHLAHTDIVPLYARLSAAEQNKIFQPHSGRRVILATNIAETSLTVPGIRYVIDPGTARISRYSVRSKVQRLPIEPISQASANQRKGRCGRVAKGICFRLYSEEDFLARPAFNDAEILRTSLAAVILQMLGMGIDDVTNFPFVDSPEAKAISDGFKLLQELGAVNNQRKLTHIGRQLEQLPIDPRLGRMLIEGQKNNALKEVLVIVSALAIQDPRERPAEKKQAADQRHREDYDDNSDFLTFVNLWNRFEEQRQTLTQNQLRKYCKQQFLSFTRMREWRDLHWQLTLACQRLRFSQNNDTAGYADVHRALLSGLLSNLGNKTDDVNYIGVRNRQFYIFPASALYKRKPKWIVASELVETSRLFARVNAKIEPDWIESLAKDLVKRHYSEPHWEKRKAQVMAFEQVTLYGLVIVARRRINYSVIDPVTCRELFIREALVEGGYVSKGTFQRKNNTLIAEVVALEEKSRRRNILVDSDYLYTFYDERIPSSVVNGASFEKWRSEKESIDPDVLVLTRQDLMKQDAAHVTEARYPDHFYWQALELPLSYHFMPGDSEDGVTLTVPVRALNLLPKYRLEWLVPGMLFDKSVALVRSLPNKLRKNFVPVPDFVRGALEAMSTCDESLTVSLGKQLTRMTGTVIPEDAWDIKALDNHFLMNINIVNEQGESLGQGRNLTQLKAQFADQSETSIRHSSASSWEKQGLKDWNFGELPMKVTQDYSGLTLPVYPALVDKKTSVAIQLFENQSLAANEHKQGLVRLLRFRLSRQLKFALLQMSRLKETKLLAIDLMHSNLLEDDLLGLLVAQVFLQDKECPTNKEAFEQLINRYKADLVPFAEKLDALLSEIFKVMKPILRELNRKNIPLERAYAMADIKQHLEHLFTSGFMQEAGMTWLSHYPRFIKAMALRLDKLPTQLNQDRAWAQELAILYKAYENRLSMHEKHKRVDENLSHYRWMLEEYRVSLFAQKLGTHYPVSEKRLRKLWLKITEV